MSSLGDDDGANGSAASSDCETEFFDSQSSSPKALGKEVEFGDHGESSQSTVPMDDTATFEEAFETQLLDLPGETQIMDFDSEAQDFGETQVMDFDGGTQFADIGGETQVLDDVNCTDHIGTQLLDVFGSNDGGEVSDSTEIVSDSDEREEKSCDKFFDTQKVLCSSVSEDEMEESMERPGTSSDQKKNSGAGSARFTSIRSASLRASGLAARRNKAVPNQTLENSAMEPEKPLEPEQDVEKYNGIMNSSRNDNMCRGGNLAMRKLFYDNVETERDEDTYDAGLSYVGSQEPGDLSQANALDFVDRFLKESVAEFGKESEHGKVTRGKNTPSLNAKGPQELANKVIKKNIVGELGIYDWDDCKEDEGGGDIFCRRKVDFFGGGRLGKKYLNTEVKGIQDGNDRRIDVFNSDSKLVFCKPKITDKTISEVRKNLTNDFSSRLEKNATKTDEPDMLDVGPDTQIAAEAMEALFHGDDTVEEPSTSRKATKQLSSRKRAGVNDASIPSRRSKRTRKLDSILDDTPVEVKETEKSKKVKKLVQAKPKSNGCKSHDRKRVQKKISQSENVVHRTGSSVKLIGFESHDRKRVQKKKICQTENVAHRTRSSVKPIAHRTRQSSSAIQVENSTKKLIGTGISSSKTLALDLYKEFEMVADFPHSETVHTFSPKRRRSLRKSVSILSPFQGLDGKLSPEKMPIIVSGTTENESPQMKSKPSDSQCSTPVNCKLAIRDISPICMGDEYFKQISETRREKKTVFRELRNLSAIVPLPISPAKELRKRREISDVRVLYSHHLEDGVIKQQKKILARLGVSVGSSMAEATHFIADQFVRTRNMLEAIASGKPVVTHLWLESCGQANCFIDEKNYLLRDAKKEKEFGFSMSTSLACASRHPLLQGLKVLVTPNTKPGIQTIFSLVKAVQGQVVERISRFLLKDGVFPDDLLVLSCEEDYATCLPFLEQGSTIYSSELLLNGIVTQKLEYDRYRLFTEHVRKTRSTVWLNKDGTKFLPVVKSINN